MSVEVQMKSVLSLLLEYNVTHSELHAELIQLKKDDKAGEAEEGNKKHLGMEGSNDS